MTLTNTRHRNQNAGKQRPEHILKATLPTRRTLPNQPEQLNQNLCQRSRADFEDLQKPTTNTAEEKNFCQSDLTERRAKQTQATISQNLDQRQERRLKRPKKIYQPENLKTRTEVNEKEKPAKTTAKKRPSPADKPQLLQNLICLCSWFSAKHLTTCVSGGRGAGVEKSQRAKKAEA